MKHILIRDKKYPILKEYDEQDKHDIVTRNNYAKEIVFKLHIVNSYKIFEYKDSRGSYYFYQSDKINLYNPLTYIFIVIAFIGTFIFKGINGIRESKFPLTVEHMCCTYSAQNVEIKED